MIWYCSIKNQSVCILLSLLLIFTLFCANAIFSHLPWYDEVISLLHVSGNAAPVWLAGVHQAFEHKAVFAGTTTHFSILESSIKLDVHPPLYFFASLAWAKVFGGGVEVLRILSLLAILACALMLYLTAQRFKPGSGIIVVPIFLCFPGTVWSAINARDYALALVFVTAVVLCLTKAFNRDQAAIRNGLTGYYILGAGLFSGLAFLTHYFTIFITSLAYFALIIRFYKSQAKYLLAGGVAFFSCIAAVLPILSIHFGARPDQYAGFGPVLYELAYLGYAILKLFSETPDWVLGKLVFCAFFVLLCLFIFIYALVDAYNSQYLSLIYVKLTLLFVVLLFFLFAVTDKTIAGSAIDRYAIFVGPLLALLSGGLIHHLIAHRVYLGAGIAFLLVFFSALTWADGRLDKEPWRTNSTFAELEKLTNTLDYEKSILVVPVGHGRGVPGTWTYWADSKQDMVIAKSSDEVKLAENDILKKKLVILVNDPTKSLNEAYEQLKERLMAEGYKIKLQLRTIQAWQK